MPFVNPFRFFALGELCAGVLTDGVEHSITPDRSGTINRDDERLVDETGDQVEHLGVLDAITAHDRFCGLDREATAEYGQAPEDHTLRRAQLSTAPVKRRLQ